MNEQQCARQLCSIPAQATDMKSQANREVRLRVPRDLQIYAPLKITALFNPWITYIIIYGKSK